MLSLTDLPEIIGFFSYSREDDEDANNSLSNLRTRIQNELRAQLGRSRSELRLWQDQEAIAPGTMWESQIELAIKQSVFFVPIITPRVVNSKYCGLEFHRFLERERELGRDDLVFPILYINVAGLDDEKVWRQHPVLKEIGSRQYVDWRDFRYELDSPSLRRAIANFCGKIVSALQRSVAEARTAAVTVDTAQALAHEEEERRQKEAEEAQQRQAEEARQREDAEHKRSQEEAAAREREAAARRAQEERNRVAAAQQQVAREERTPTPTAAVVAGGIRSDGARRTLAALIILQGLLWELGLILAAPATINFESLLLIILPFVAIMYIGISLFRSNSQNVVIQTLGMAIIAFVASVSIDVIIIPDIANFGRNSVVKLSVFTGTAISAISILWAASKLKAMRKVR